MSSQPSPQPGINARRRQAKLARRGTGEGTVKSPGDDNPIVPGRRPLGAATTLYQAEGAVDEDGRDLPVWGSLTGSTSFRALCSASLSKDGARCYKKVANTNALG